MNEVRYAPFKLDKEAPYALCPMPYALCPPPRSISRNLREAIYDCQS
ncbi:MAG: hypothetical protein WBL95_14960 [Microcoleus sp.]